MSLPVPNMSFSPFAILTAEEMNDIVENIEALSAGNGLANGAVTTPKLQDGSVTPDKLSTGAARAEVNTSEQTANQFFSDLGTTTDYVSVGIGDNGLAIVSIGAVMAANAINTVVQTGFEVSGSSSVQANDMYSIDTQVYAANARQRMAGTFLVTDLTPGPTTFKMKYKVNGNTGTWAGRHIAVVPI